MRPAPERPRSPRRPANRDFGPRRDRDASRGQRDLFRQPLERDERNNRGRTGLGTIIDDDGLPTLAIDDVTVLEGQRHGQRDLHCLPSRVERPSGLRRLRDRRRQRDRREPITRPRAATLIFDPGQISRTLTVQVTSDPSTRSTRRSWSTSPTRRQCCHRGWPGRRHDHRRRRAPFGVRQRRHGHRGQRDGVNANFTLSLSAPSGQTVSVHTRPRTARQPPRPTTRRFH